MAKRVGKLTMDFNTFLSKINALKAAKLGGLEAHFLLAPALRLRYDTEKIKAANPKKAAVLALFYPNKHNETCFLLTQRASYSGTHSNQISFPGGKIEKTDLNLQETALRETFEEVGLQKNNASIIRELTTVFIPPSNFLATPFLGFTKQKPIFTTNYEVEKTLEIKVDQLLDDNNITSIRITNSYATDMKVPSFNFNGYLVWGATAMILSEIKDLLK